MSQAAPYKYDDEIETSAMSNAPASEDDHE